MNRRSAKRSQIALQKEGVSLWLFGLIWLLEPAGHRPFRGLALLKPKLKEIRVTTTLAPGLPPVRANPIKLEQVLINLIANAVDAFAEGEGSERKELSISADRRKGGITIEVSDTAGGIPQEVADKVFKTYVSTKPIHLGTGLGLMVTRANVHALGGEITFRTQPGEGTTFTIHLPDAGGQPEENRNERTDPHH